MKTHTKTDLLLAVGIGLILSDIIPTPADALYFYKQRINKKDLEEGKITPKQYWIKDAALYYGLNPIWWGLVLGASYQFGKTFEQKKNIFLSLVASGAVIGVIYKNIKKDDEYYASKKG